TPLAAGMDSVQTAVLPAHQVQPGQVQQVQSTSDMARMVHQLVEPISTAHEDLEIIERRSQLMRMRAKVTRWAVADPAIVDIVQYNPMELGLIGMSRGTTTLTIWFENHPDPLVYVVRTIYDPDLDNQRKLDYGKLEQRINRLFPNSKVYLIPMS